MALNRTNILLSGLLVLVALLTAATRVNYSQPNFEILPDMKYTPAWQSYAPNPVFATGRTLQRPRPARSPAGGCRSISRPLRKTPGAPEKNCKIPTFKQAASPRGCSSPLRAGTTSIECFVLPATEPREPEMVRFLSVAFRRRRRC